MSVLLPPLPALDTDPNLVDDDPEEGENDDDKEKEYRENDFVIEKINICLCSH